MEGKILIGGHRGRGATDDENVHNRNIGRVLPLENTLDSFKKALDFGVDADFIETDAVATKNGGEIVLIHSNDTSTHIKEKKFNTTGETFIDAMTAQEVASLKTGSDGSGRIPTLLELLEAVEKFPSKFINIELKGIQGTRREAPPLVEPLLKIIKNKGFPLDRILFSSFSLNTLDELKRRTFNQAKIGVLFCKTNEYLLKDENYLPYSRRRMSTMFSNVFRLYMP